MDPIVEMGGKLIIMSMIDFFSRYIILVPTANYTVGTVPSVVYRHLIAYFVVSAAILSNRSTEFMGTMW